MINFDELKDSKDYSKITGEDLLEFMSTKPRKEIDEFKAFCATPKKSEKEDGTTIERVTSFFEMRNWVLDKYYPGLTDAKTSKTKTSRLIDKIMEL